MMKNLICPICNNNSFIQTDALTSKLIDEWELNEAQATYINQQQGLSCQKCGSNLRSMTLAASIMDHYSINTLFNEFHYTAIARKNKILEINEAGYLHKYLKKCKKYVFGEYPEIDMQSMKLANDSFDIIIHSDTLEHVPDSTKALSECRRILKPGGVMFYTIPIVFEKLSRSRQGMDNSYHGSQEESQGEDYKVWKEYGADFWAELYDAGFKQVKIFSLLSTSSLSIIAIKTTESKYKTLTYWNMRKFINAAYNRFKKLFYATH